MPIIPPWMKTLGIEKRKGGAVLTATLPAEKVEGWWRRVWRKVMG